MTGRARVIRVLPSQHLGYVQLIRGGEGGYFAVCPSCGSLKTPDRATHDEAHADVVAHVEDMTRSYIAARWPDA
jgi:hypothetical protein